MLCIDPQLAARQKTQQQTHSQMSHLPKTFKAESLNDSPKFKNEYLHGLLDPFSAKELRMPDTSVQSLLPKTLSYMSTLTTTNQETGFIVYTPHSRDTVFRLYRYDTVSKLNYYVDSLKPNEDLTDDFANARPITGACTLVSDTISSTTTTLGGTVHAVSFNDMPVLKDLTVQSLTSFKKDDASAALNIKLSNGIMAVAEPNSNLAITPFTTNAVNPVDVVLGASFYPTPPSRNLSLNFYSVPTIPPNFWGSFTVYVHLGYTTVTGGAPMLLFINVTGNQWINGVLTPVVSQRSFSCGQLNYAGGDALFEADFDVPWDVESIYLSTNATGTTQPDIYLESSQYYSMNTRSPGMILMYDGCSANQILKFTAVQHYEVQPDQKLSKNVSTSYDKNGESFLDMKAVQYIFAHKDKFGIRSIYPLDEYKFKKLNGYFENMSSQDYSSYVAGDLSSLVKSLGKYATPLIGGLLSAYNPALGMGATLIGNSLFASDLKNKNKENEDEFKVFAGSFKGNDQPLIWPPSEQSQKKITKEEIKKLEAQILDLKEKRKLLGSSNEEKIEKEDDTLSEASGTVTASSGSKGNPIDFIIKWDTVNGTEYSPPSDVKASSLEVKDEFDVANSVRNYIIIYNKILEISNKKEEEMTNFEIMQLKTFPTFVLEFTQKLNQLKQNKNYLTFFEEKDRKFLEFYFSPSYAMDFSTIVDTSSTEEKPKAIEEKKDIIVETVVPPEMKTPWYFYPVKGEALDFGVIEGKKKILVSSVPKTFYGFSAVPEQYNSWGKARGPAIKENENKTIKQMLPYEVYYNNQKKALVTDDLTISAVLMKIILTQGTIDQTTGALTPTGEQKILSYKVIINPLASKYIYYIAMMLAMASKDTDEYHSIQMFGDSKMEGNSCLAAIYSAIIGIPYFDDVFITGDIDMGPVKYDPDYKKWYLNKNKGLTIQKINYLTEKINSVNKLRIHLVFPQDGLKHSNTWDSMTATINPLMSKEGFSNASVSNFSEYLLYLYLLKNRPKEKGDNVSEILLKQTLSDKTSTDNIITMQEKYKNLQQGVSDKRQSDRLLSSLEKIGNKIYQVNKIDVNERNPRFIKTLEGEYKNIMASLQQRYTKLYELQYKKKNFTGTITVENPYKTAYKLITTNTQPFETFRQFSREAAISTIAALALLTNAKISDEDYTKFTENMDEETLVMVNEIVDLGIPVQYEADWTPRIHIGESFIDFGAQAGKRGYVTSKEGLIEEKNKPSKGKNKGIKIIPKVEQKTKKVTSKKKIPVNTMNLIDEYTG